MKLDGESFGCGLVVGAFLMLIVCVALLWAAALVMQKRGAEASAPKSYPASAFCPVVGDEAVTSALKPIRQKFGVPAMAAAVWVTGGRGFNCHCGCRKAGGRGRLTAAAARR